MLMEQKNKVCDGSAAPVLRLQPRHITPSLPPNGGRGNAGSSFEDSDEDFIACMVFIFKIKRTSGNNGFPPFSSGQLPTFFGNSPPN